MHKTIFFLALILSSTLAQAVELTIDAPNMLRAGDLIQFRAVVIDRGFTTDVTRSTRFAAPYREEGPGLFQIEPTLFGEDQYFTLTAKYTDQNGEVINAQKQILVTSRPDYVLAQGPRYVDPRFVYKIFNQAHFGDKTFDVAGKSRWQSYCGIVDSEGVYHPRISHCNERLTLLYGGHLQDLYFVVY